MNCEHGARGDLGGESRVVDGVLGAAVFAGAEVKEHVADSVHVRQRSAGHVDGARTEVVDDQSHVVTGVHQRAAHLHACVGINDQRYDTKRLYNADKLTDSQLNRPH